MKNSTLFKVLGAIVLAVIAGFYTTPDTNIAGISLIKLYDLVGRLFLNALTLVVVPLVSASIITGTARMGGEESFGKLGLKTFGYFVLTTTLAALVGYAFVTWMEPGGSHSMLNYVTIDDAKLKAIENASGDGAFAKISQVLLTLVPLNIIAAAAQGQMLGLIIFCLLFGYFISKIEAQPASVMLSFWKAVFQIMMKITQLVMRALPIGVFALVAKVVSTSGLEAFKDVGWFVLTILAAFAFHVLVILPLFLKYAGGINPIAHFKAMSPAILTAFSTSSSAATLPVTIECVEKRAGVSNRICSFTVPLGTSINMQGTALFEVVVVLFIAQAYGINLSLSSQFIVILMSILTSFGMPGIPSASLVVMVLILQTIGLPAEGIGLIYAVDRVVDMFRTIVNVFGNSCCSVVIARSEGEIDVLAPNKQEQPVKAA